MSEFVLPSALPSLSLSVILLINPQPRRKAFHCQKQRLCMPSTGLRFKRRCESTRGSLQSSVSADATQSSIGAPPGAEKKDQCAREAVNNYLSIGEEPQLIASPQPISHPGGRDAPLLPLDTSRLQPSASLFNFLPMEQEASARNVL